MERVGRRGSRFGRGIVGMWQREAGDISPRTFARRVGASEDLILRLRIDRKLDKHRGCVNTVSFNGDGNILASGSDDRMVTLWDWDSGHVKLSFHSGHVDNVFQARFMPYTDDQTIVTCGADGEVRHAQILEGGQVATTLLKQHEGQAHKMAIEPGSPHIFYSCGEDGAVYHFDLRTKSSTLLFVCYSSQNKSSRPVVRLNAIAIDPMNPNRFAIAGSGEYARVYDIRKCNWDGATGGYHPSDILCPPHLVGNRKVGITGLAFSDQSELLVSYNDELIYLFSRDQGLGLHPASSPGGSAMYADTVNGSNSVSASLSTPDPKSGPLVYKGHQNSETVKGVSFFGPRCEYVVSGSDCGRIFIWRKKSGELLRMMEGDKYVVNCIEPHPYATVMASSGIESDIKIWTPNDMKRAPPVNMDELKHKRRTRFCPLAFPEDLITRILALQRRRSNSDRSGVLLENAELVDLIMEYTDGDALAEDSGDMSSSPADCIVS